MVGLMNPAGAAPEAGKPGMGQAKAAPPQGDGTAGAPNVSPEEQAQYDQFVGQAMNMMYDEKITPTIVKSLSNAESPAEGLGRTLAMIVMRVEDAAQDQGVSFSGDVMLHGAEELLEQLVEIGEAAGLKDYTPEEMESALYLGLDTYRATRQQQGRLPVDEISQDFDALLAADQSGDVDSIVPGLSGYAQNVEIPPEMAAGNTAEGAR